MIFFDIDATILDHEKAEKLGALAFLKDNYDELKLDSSEFTKRWEELSDKYFEKYLSKELSFQEQRRMRMKELFGSHLSEGQADDKFDDYLAFYRGNWSVFEDVVPCLEYLKKQGKRMGVISNGDYQQQVEKLHKINIIQYFDCIITSSEIGVAKPNATIFTEACRIADVPIHESYYIGDRLETDAIGSKNAGMQGIWLNRKDKTVHSDVLVLHDLSELRRLIT
ncbi:putative hydrolase of the HAD superfamily [Natronobacillus azotifigens]|uniref:HAD family hydrolase n=1 Tax=Natronobacillus azotifigens TaxID=472978 RepID=A0A9J6RED9_9BACI|nr:HAD family hydrolase [Natronobacillus azotifigens]MCZ0703750.1 HAD family hydrolase [Natronobacillus azotifigens]